MGTFNVFMGLSHRMRAAVAVVLLAIAGVIACVVPATAHAAYSTSRISDLDAQRTSSVYYKSDYNYYDDAVVTYNSSVGVVDRGNDYGMWWNDHYKIRSYTSTNSRGTISGNPLMTIKLPNYGYTVEGKDVDLVITIKSVTMDGGNGWNEEYPDNWFLEIAKGKKYALRNDGWIVLEAPDWWKTEIVFNIKVVYAGTSTKVPDTIRGTETVYLYEFNDIDTSENGIWIDGDVHPGNDWTERITRSGNNFFDTAYISSSSNGVVGVSSDNKTYYAKRWSDGGHQTNDYDDEGTVIFHGKNDVDFIWRGTGCGTILGINGQVKNYPVFTDPKKSPATQTRAKGAKCADFTIEQWLPAVSADNQPNSIVVSDTFDNALDISGVTASDVKVYSGSTDVTSKWTFSKSGQKVSFTAKNTAHDGGAEGDMKFVISNVKVKSDANLSSYSTTTESSTGRTCWVIKNKATTTVTPKKGNVITKTSNEVNVLVPKPANVVYKYVGSYHPTREPSVPQETGTYYIGDNYKAKAAVTDPDGRYTFSGWCSNNTATTAWPAAGQKLTQETTYIYGKWTPNPVKIVYQYVGPYQPSPAVPVPTEPTNTYYIEDIYKAKPAVSDPTGNYDFAGWYADSACTTKWPTNGKALEATTTNLYGKWTPRPKVTPAKSVSADKFNVSETATYTVKVTQTVEGATTSSVTIVDDLHKAGTIIDNGATYVANSLKVTGPTGTDITSNATITWTGDNKFKVVVNQSLSYNQAVTITYKVKLGTTTTKALQKKSYTNEVTATCNNQATPQAETPLKSTTTIYVREPKLVADKSVNKTYVDAGDTVTYTLKATNTGGDADSVAYNVKMVDAFPAQLLADGATVDLASIVVKDHNGATVSCTPTMDGNNLVIATDVDLPDGKAMTATVPVKLGDRGNIMSGRSYENVLTVSSDNSNSDTDNARIEVSDPELATTKTATEDFINTSERGHFTVTGTNKTENSKAYNISFTDRLTDSAVAAGAWIDLDTLKFTLPNGSVLPASDYTVTPVKKQGRVAGFDIKSSATLAYNEVITITFDVVAGETTSIDLQDTAIPNTARVNASNSKTPGNQATDTIEVYTPELTIIKETTMPVANVADHVPYKITVEQVVEGAIAWNIHLTDDIQQDFAALGGTWDLGSFHVMDQNNADRVSECGFTTNADKSRLDIATPISLGYHEKMTVLYDVIFGETTTREMQGHDYTNIVTANADNTRQDVTDDATVHVPVPHAKATKTVDKPVVNVTDKVVYTLVAENDGEDGSCLRNVTFTDVMPAKMIASGAVIDAANITATQGGLPLTIVPVVDGNTIKIETGQSLYKGDNITVLVPVTVGNRASWELCGATWQNELTVTTDNTDPAQDTAEITVLKPDLNLVKTPGVEIANISDRIDYTVVATNLAEGSLAFDPTITDELAELAVAEHAYIDQSTIKIEHSNGTNLTGAATITWKLNEEGQAIGYTAFVPCDISDADSLTITYTAVSGLTTSQELMKEGMDNEVEGTLSNDPDPRDDTATVAFYTPVLEIIKTADAKYLNAGDTAGYTLVVHQLEEGAIAWNIVIEDALAQDAFDRGAYMLAESWKLFYDGEEVDPESLEWIDFSEVDVKPADDEQTKPAEDEQAKPADDEGSDTQDDNGSNLLTADPDDVDQGSDPDQVVDPDQDGAADEDEAVVPDGPEQRARGFVTETGIDLAKDHEIKITYDVKAGAYDVNTLSGTDIENVARATGDNVPEPAEDINIIPVLFPHLAVEKTADRHWISTYESVEYQVAAEVTEENAIAHDVVFEDTFTWAGAEGAVDADKIAASIVVDLDGKALELGADAVSVEGEWQNGEGTIKIHVETASELPYGSVMTMTYNVMFGEREANAPVLAQVIDNVATVSCSNGEPVQDDEQIEILDAELAIDKKGVNQGPASIFYEVDVAQVKENAIARDVVITDKLADAAVVSGVSLNKDVVVFDAAGKVVEAKITYIENGAQVIGYTAEVGDLAFGESVKVAYSSNAATLGFGFTEVVNTATASALNAAEVADTEIFSFDGGVAPDLIQTGDEKDPLTLVGFIAATAAAAASASVIRRRRQ